MTMSAGAKVSLAIRSRFDLFAATRRKLHQEQRPAVRRQELEQEADAVVTRQELWRRRRGMNSAAQALASHSTRITIKKLQSHGKWMIVVCILQVEADTTLQESDPCFCAPGQVDA